MTLDSRTIAEVRETLARVRKEYRSFKHGISHGFPVVSPQFYKTDSLCIAIKRLGNFARRVFSSRKGGKKPFYLAALKTVARAREIIKSLPGISPIIANSRFLFVRGER